ncbi:hypothetical protein [Roseobacter denitrificans]|uniref:Lipocalin-like domain-containing protein n=2 Tax=Roseobacter denitrificans TaxID=2434 RepID=Q166L3_ROSDO|nr:hypothetical protein [Roseobacter denitrificans]ABG32080.1 hypothetical protein RD1_2522 [Roseobacter denitrificans OCh 114]SFF77069.1 apolipoprotein D and lipocalin family protein [Roseobacter denitrificans OCh 114]
MLATALLCASCAVERGGAYRDAAAPMGVTTRFDAARFAGSWMLWESFGPAAPGSFVFEERNGVLQISGPAALDLAGDYRNGAPGEFVAKAPNGETLVVMWVDEDFETAAIGTVSGSFGAILDRDGFVPPDRAQAARDIMEFYGWDVRTLERTVL